MAPDELDRAEEQEWMARQEAVRQASKPLAPGKAGNCDWCGEPSPRLINQACPRCRDQHKLP